MTNTVYTLEIELGESDPDQKDTLARHLREELYDLGVDSAEVLSAGEAPAGSKSADAITIGALAVAILPTFLPRLVEYLQTWCMRAENRKVRIKTQVGDRSVEVEYSPSALSQEELTQLVTRLSNSLKTDTNSSS